MKFGNTEKIIKNLKNGHSDLNKLKHRNYIGKRVTKMIT